MSSPSRDEIVNTIFNRLYSETNITATKKNSFVSVIVNVCADLFLDLYRELENVKLQSNVRTASGQYLDDWGINLGLPRITTQKSGTPGRARVVVFTNNTGANISVPLNTRIFSSTRPSLVFFTTENVLVTASSTADVHVIAADTGSIYNISAGEIDSHSLPNVSLSVTNLLPIDNGTDQESDDSYRFRLIQEFQSRYSLNEDNYRTLFRRVPGVKKVNIETSPGAVEVTIFTNLNADSGNVISQCIALADEFTPVGTKVTILSPENVDLQISVSLGLKEGVSLDSVKQTVTNTVQAYIDSLELSSNPTLYVQTLNSRILSTSTDIQSSICTVYVNKQPIRSTGQYSLPTNKTFKIQRLVVS